MTESDLSENRGGTLPAQERWMFVKCVHVAIGFALVSVSALAVPLSFQLYPTSNSNPNVASQFSAEVTDFGNNQALFRIANNGPISSTITDILFYDGALLSICSLSDRDDSISGLTPNGGVDFTKNKPFHPDALPRYPAASFGADRDAGPGGASNGIDPNEYLDILFKLKSEQDFQALFNQLKTGQVFIGLHVQRIGSAEGSDWFISTPPEGGRPEEVPDGGLTLALLGGVMCSLELFRRRIRSC
jgi:hypothetical protein